MEKKKRSLNEDQKLFLMSIAKRGPLSRFNLRKYGIYGGLLTNFIKYDILLKEVDVFGNTVYRVNDDVII